MTNNPFVGKWTYRSLLNNPDLGTGFDKLEFGRATLEILDDPDMTILRGTLGGPGWQLTLQGSRAYGSPMAVRFQGRGIVSGNEWIYDYQGYLAPYWPNGVQQLPAMIGTIVRTIPHPSSGGGVSPAGVTASWYAVKV